jgi:hypothetical protein
VPAKPMNILLTNRCNRRCPYCFAAERVGLAGEGAPARPAPESISNEDFERALLFAVRSGERSVSLLGGEPSLHPEFPALLSRALATRRLRVKVFTNGVWPVEHRETVAAALESRALRRLAIIVNVNSPSLSSADERREQAALFEALGPVCSLSCNVHSTELDLRPLLDLFDEHPTLRRHVRVAIAQPLAAGKSEFVPVRDYEKVAPRIMELVEACDERDITVGFDCGFTLCMFSTEELGRLVQAGVLPRATCEPCIDVGTDLSVWACFPLSVRAPAVALENFETTAALRAHFRATLYELYDAGALDECGACRFFRREQCAGGCAAHLA